MADSLVGSKECQKADLSVDSWVDKMAGLSVGSMECQKADCLAGQLVGQSGKGITSILLPSQHTQDSLYTTTVQLRFRKCHSRSPYIQSVQCYH